MEKWLIQSIWISVFGYLKEFRPEDPYIFQYLTQPPLNFTSEEVSVIFNLLIRSVIFSLRIKLFSRN